MIALLTRLGFCSILVATLSTTLAFSCDDPPYHYKHKCQAYVPRSSAYAPIVENYGLFTKYGVKFELQRADEKELRELIGRAHLVQVPATTALEQALVRSDFRIIATLISRATADIWVR